MDFLELYIPNYASNHVIKYGTCAYLLFRWFGLTCLALNDPTSKLELETFSQSIHIPKVHITKAEESTPSNYNLRWSGLSFTLGEVIIGSGQAHGDWHSKISGTLYVCMSRLCTM